MLTEQTSSVEKFAALFTAKDLEGLSALFADDCTWYDPTIKWMRGKEAVLDVLRTQFNQTGALAYEVVRVHEAGSTSIVEFRLALDDIQFEGVDIMELQEGKIASLRSFYNAPIDSSVEELKPYSKEAQALQPGALYEHYKGKQYELVAVGRHSESLEEMVVYRGLYEDNPMWVRPLALFIENVLIKGEVIPRFKCVG